MVAEYFELYDVFQMNLSACDLKTKHIIATGIT